MIGFYDYTVILTYCSLASAIIGIYNACQGHPTLAVICLLFCGLCDMFDGKIARTKKNRTMREKSFGIQIDSLCDLVCFGILPAAISYECAFRHTFRGASIVGVTVMTLYVLCAVIRLANYNMCEEERQRETDEIRKSYTGLPVTSSALIFPTVYGIEMLLGLGRAFPFAFAGVMSVCAIAFITPFKLKKPHGKMLLVFVFAGLLVLAFVIYAFCKTRSKF